jgi:hypothetical protein
MASFNFTVPDAAVPRVVEAFCVRFGYQETSVDGVPNPETRGDFTRRMIREFIKDTVVSHEASLAGRDASASQAAETRSEVDVT